MLVLRDPQQGNNVLLHFSIADFSHILGSIQSLARSGPMSACTNSRHERKSAQWLRCGQCTLVYQASSFIKRHGVQRRNVLETAFREIWSTSPSSNWIFIFLNMSRLNFVCRRMMGRWGVWRGWPPSSSRSCSSTNSSLPSPILCRHKSVFFTMKWLILLVQGSFSIQNNEHMHYFILYNCGYCLKLPSYLIFSRHFYDSRFVKDTLKEGYNTAPPPQILFLYTGWPVKHDRVFLVPYKK